MLSETLLDVEVRIGELLKLIPKTSGGDRKSENIKSNSTVTFEKTKEQTINELGFNKMQAQRLETLADNKDLVEQVKAHQNRQKKKFYFIGCLNKNLIFSVEGFSILPSPFPAQLLYVQHMGGD